MSSPKRVICQPRADVSVLYAALGALAFVGAVAALSVAALPGVVPVSGAALAWWPVAPLVGWLALWACGRIQARAPVRRAGRIAAALRPRRRLAAQARRVGARGLRPVIRTAAA